jgi:hypothetical protein
MAAPFWSPSHLGCVERESFQLHPNNRTVLSSLANPPRRSKKGDTAGPITASMQVNQTLAQWSAFVQWHRNDLSGGARPFYIDLWLWDRTRRVRARFVGPWRASRSLHNAFATQCTVEIERESIT